MGRGANMARRETILKCSALFIVMWFGVFVVPNVIRAGRQVANVHSNEMQMQVDTREHVLLASPDSSHARFNAGRVGNAGAIGRAGAIGITSSTTSHHLQRSTTGRSPHAGTITADPALVEICYQKVVNDVLTSKKLNTMVVPERRVATAWLAKMAILSPVEGDIIEAGVAAGGMAAVMSSLLACSKSPKKLFMADSWEGLPNPSTTRFPNETSQFKGGEFLRTFDVFKNHMRSWGEFWEAEGAVDSPRGHTKPGYQTNTAISEVDTRKPSAFPSGSWPDLDDSRYVLKGLFDVTLPKIADDQRFSLVRCDGDMYSSTYDCMEFLYPKLSCGGWIYIDDYWEFEECRKAVFDYFGHQGIDGNGVTMFTILQHGQMYEWVSDLQDIPGKGKNDKPWKAEAVFWQKPQCDMM